MFRFFNQKSRACALMQALNTTALLIALNEIINDPEHAWEWGLEALTHFVSILALVEKPSLLGNASSVSLNFMRIGAIFSGVTSGCSTLSNLTNLFDAAGHLGNIVVPVATAEREPARVPHSVP
ncbi:hypothetical protein [Legionella tunisiensis]|uniref:hypothetical protein n=1 Tax=Legionella tunisiensis TaxID=1034944 RepID=UPI0002E50773|nr:hypothetical protein [Legionella tunisiensis]